MGVSSEGQGGRDPLNFHTRYKYSRDFKVLFFGIIFLLIFGLFSVALPHPLEENK